MGITMVQQSKPSPFEVRTVKCAQCDVQKQQSNHWYVLEVIADTFVAERLDPGRALLIGEVPVCGQSCAQRLFERFLQSGQL